MDWIGPKLIRQCLCVAVAVKEHLGYASRVSALPWFGRIFVRMHHARWVMFVSPVAVARRHAYAFKSFVIVGRILCLWFCGLVPLLQSNTKKE